MATDIIGEVTRVTKSEKLLKCEVKAKTLYWQQRTCIIDFIIVLLILFLKEANHLNISWKLIGIMVVLLLILDFIVFPVLFKVSRSFNPRNLTITANYLENRIAHEKKRRWSLYDRLESFKQQGITTSFDKHENLVKREVTENLDEHEKLLEEIKDLFKEYFGK